MKSWIVFLCGMGCLLLGCAPTRTRLDVLYDTSFSELKVPEASWIQQGPSQKIPNASFEQVWEACMEVLTQEGLVVRASKKDRIFVVMGSWPFALWVSEGDEVQVALNWMNDFLDPANGQRPSRRPADPAREARFSNWLFSKIQTQVSTNDRWPYLR